MKKTILEKHHYFKACKNGNETIVKYFVEHGVNINKINKYGKTSLFYVCKYGNKISIVNYLVEYGVNLNRKNQIIKLYYIMYVKIIIE